MKYWQDVSPCMMSDEEKCDEGYIRHPPSYRSELFNKFIAKLESRCDKAPNHQPRKKRILGSPVKKSVPPNTKNWLLNPEFRPDDSKEMDTSHIDSEVDSDNSIEY